MQTSISLPIIIILTRESLYSALIKLFASTVILAFGEIIVPGEAAARQPSFVEGEDELAQFKLREIRRDLDVMALNSGSHAGVTKQRERRHQIEKYIAAAETIFAGDVILLPADEQLFFLKLRDEAIDEFCSGWGAVPQDDPHGRRLVAWRGWIYFRNSIAEHYSKVMPGAHPHWYVETESDSNRQNLDRFFVFLPTAFNEQDTDLWVASIREGLLVKICTIERSVGSPPSISPNGKRFAFINRPQTTSEGESYTVTILDLPVFHERGVAKVPQVVVYETRTEEITKLQWMSAESLRVFTRKSAEAALEMSAIVTVR